MTSWDNYRQSLRRHISQDSLANFLEWSTIQATMYVGNAPYLKHEFAQVPPNHYGAVANPYVGTSNKDSLCTNLIHQYYHLKQWLDRTRQNLSEMSSIIEFGAGYGAMATVIYRLGFRGKYHIIDLPELSFLQQHYLSSVLPEDWGDVYWLNTLPSSSLSGDLFIASHSLGETLPEDREKLLAQVTAREYLFASSYEFEGVDNQGWFQRLAGSIMGVDWLFYPHPYQENAFYLVGTELPCHLNRH